MSLGAIFKAVFSVLVLPNLVGNSLVVFVILRSPAMKSPMNYLLLNLAASDLLMGMAMLPRFLLSDIVDLSPGNTADILCKALLLGNLGWVGAISSIFSLVLIAVERFYVVAKPLNSLCRITTKRLRIFITVCWIIAAVFCTPIFYISHFGGDFGTCVYTWRGVDWYPLGYNVLWLSVAALLPTGVMIVLYAKVAYFLWSDTGDVTSQAVRRSRRKVTVTVFALSVVYAVCWFPDLVMHVVSKAAPEQFSLDHPIHTVAICLVVVNSSVNPVVYAFRFEQFKRELIKIVCCGRRFGQSHVANQQSEIKTRDARDAMPARKRGTTVSMRGTTATAPASDVVARARVGRASNHVVSLTTKRQQVTTANETQVMGASECVTQAAQASASTECEQVTQAAQASATTECEQVTQAGHESAGRERNQVTQSDASNLRLAGVITEAKVSRQKKNA